MKLRSLAFACAVGLMSGSAFAANNHHAHVDTNAKPAAAADKKESMIGCDITIINSTYKPVDVYGTYDDGNRINFRIYPFDDPHYIDMFYYGYCHAGMNLNIYANYGRELVYSGYAQTNTTINVYPTLTKQIKAEVKQK